MKPFTRQPIAFMLCFSLLCLVFRVCHADDFSQVGDQSDAGTSRTKINAKDGATMVFIPAGEFLMGDDDDRIADTVVVNPVRKNQRRKVQTVRNNPRHKVTLSGYWIYKDLVTVGMYKVFCQATAKKMPAAPDFNPDWSKEDHPMVNVTWDDAVAYCKWAEVTLPTEAQWEKAARGVDGRKFAWGDMYDLSKVWASKNHAGDAGGTTSVGKYGVSPYGCTDMSGNVWQWCADWYDTTFWAGRAAEESNPVNVSVGEKSERVLRGGYWGGYNEINFRASFRYRGDPGGKGDGIGFRGAAFAPNSPVKREE